MIEPKHVSLEHVQHLKVLTFFFTSSIRKKNNFFFSVEEMNHLKVNLLLQIQTEKFYSIFVSTNTLLFLGCRELNHNVNLLLLFFFSLSETKSCMLLILFFNSIQVVRGCYLFDNLLNVNIFRDTVMIYTHTISRSCIQLCPEMHRSVVTSFSIKHNMNIIMFI